MRTTLLLLVASGLPATPGVVPQSAPVVTVDSLTPLPGREADTRVAAIAYRLATAGARRCPTTEPLFGLVLQHLSQFRPADRSGMIAALALDRGPAVIVVVPGGPAAMAGILPRDVLLAIDGLGLPHEDAGATRFDAARARVRADTVVDLLAHGGSRPVSLTLLRDGEIRTVRITPVSACPAQVELARSSQHNAYADARHVFLTTGLVSLVRSDDELAFVIAHEMAHVILGHAAVMRGGDVKYGLGRTLGHSGHVVRETERAADRLGGELMLDAGYDPGAGAGVLTRLDGIDLGVFTSHDSAGARITAMRALVAERRNP